MKITRKLQYKIELKIRHAVETGRLHVIKRPALADSTESKLAANGAVESK